MLLKILKKQRDCLSACLQRCMICHQRSAQPYPLCDHCAPLLPWLEHYCIRCASPLPATYQGKQCNHCRKHPDHIFAARSLFCFAYQNPIDSIIKAWKFNQSWPMHFFLTHCLVQHINDNLPKSAWPDAIVAVPASRKRLQQRGFNQASVLTKAIQRTLGIPRIDHLIQCSKDHPHQARLTARDRSHNLNHAYTIKAHTPLPQHIAIVDDVMTTGATCQAIAQLLITHGARTIQYWGLARTTLGPMKSKLLAK